jgi:hypothetical protein
MTKHPNSVFLLLLAICVLFSATLGFVAPLCSALEQAQYAEDCHAVMADDCHGSECKAHSLAGTAAHGCCLNLIAVLPSLGSFTVRDEHTPAVSFLASLRPQSRAERLFRPPRSFS